MVISMEKWKGKVAVVTGASAGIGAAIVEALVDAGMKVAGLARRKEKIEELAKKLEGKSGKLYAVRADTSKEEDILSAFKWVKENLGPVHVLINNAGIARNTKMIAGDTKMWKEVLDTNVLGLCIATREAVKSMRENNVDGHVVHISSLLAHKIPPYENINIYPASKHAVRALTETLRQELNSIGSKIRITSISPGVVTTEIRDASGLSSNVEQEKEFQTLPALKSEDIADSVIYVLSTPSHVQIHDIIIQPVGEKF